MAGTCFICNEDLNVLGVGVSRVGEKGITSLLEASTARNDNKGFQVSGLTSLEVHTVCRKNYTRPGSIQSDIKRQHVTSTSSQSDDDDQPVVLRSSLPKFDFKTKCFFCTEIIDEQFKEREKKRPKERRRVVYDVRSLSLKDKVMDAAAKRNDKWAEQVKIRLSTVCDLVAVEGVYHKDCFTKFHLHATRKGDKIGRPEADYVSTAMEEICSFLENNDDCQHALSDLRSAVTGRVPDDHTIKTKLIEKYGDRVVIAQEARKGTTICFIDMGIKILNAWYQNKRKNATEERLRIVETAAAIIRQDIQSHMCEKTTYPAGDNFLKDANTCVPTTLLTFLEKVTMNKTRDSEKNKRKCISIAHSIITSVRPRSFVSPILVSLGLLIYRKYGSKNLVNLLSSLGFCSSYYEVQLLEMSAILHTYPDINGAFSQFVFDNADFNACTIDGLNTFHAMGGIQCITPESSVVKRTEIPRLPKIPSSEMSGNLGVLPLKVLGKTGGGLKKVIMEDLGLKEQETPQPKPYDILWLCAKWFGVLGVPAWKGFMHSITTGMHSEKTKVVPLPFINSPPSDYDTIYTALQFAADVCFKINQKSLIVTFDQPLYIKAKEITAAAPTNSLLSKCILRLGGFHLLMSFLGCIGYLMDGSGIKELMSIIYAPASVDKMLQGHAFARAVRAHLLIQAALSQIILEELDIGVEERKAIDEVMSQFLDENPSLNSLNQNHPLISLAKKLEGKLTQIKTNGLTASLWVLYFNMVTLVKEYIHAERSGDWDVHLRCVQQMLPFFHACGRFAYAKSCHLYVQDMRKLPSIMTPEEHDKFVNKGYFTMRRTDRFWTGVWSDMTIEQTLMRSMKSVGGLTRGRGVTDSVVSKWVLGLSATHDICLSLEEFCGVNFCSSEQHEDFRESSKARDDADITKILLWLKSHYPFPVTEEIMSVATGVVGDTTITCYDAVAVGKKAMAKMVGKPFTDVKLSRKDQALPLASMTCSVKIHNDKVVVDPFMIFQRISISKQNDDDLKICLQHELAPFPLALFDEAGMRKTKKSALYDMFQAQEMSFNVLDFDIVLDGGSILHKVTWPRNSVFSAICQSYIHYILTHYSGKSTTVVFDGYASTANSTKYAEQSRRYRLKKSADIHFGDDTAITVKQDHFLSNGNNKSRLISMLSAKLIENGIECITATEDADTLIVTTAIDKSIASDKVAVIGEDIDLVVLLTALTPAGREILFVKPSHGNTKTKIYSSNDSPDLRLKNNILFIHAFTGCDTTCAAFRKGKVSSFKLLKKHNDLQDIADVFNSPTSSHKTVAEAGNRCFLKLYGAPAKEASLNLYRYHSFIKTISNAKPDISALPPTEGAAKQHSFRVYHQVQLWQGNKLPPELWGWDHKQNQLMPVTTKEPVAPDFILNAIFCKCTTGCGGGKCGCRKRAMNCTNICHNCHGECLNGFCVTPEEANEEVDDLQHIPEATVEDVNPGPSTSAVHDSVSRPTCLRKKLRIM